MANPVSEVVLTEAPLEFPEASQGYGEGAVVEFRGVVRPGEDGRMIEGLEYETHGEMAEHQLQVLVDQAVERFDLKLVQIHHRVGFVAVGEASLFLRVMASHRPAAFQASQWLIDELKKTVPIWKKPRFSEHGAPQTGEAQSPLILRQ